MSGIKVYCADVTDWDKTRTIIGNIGPVHLLVNNAGIYTWEPFLKGTKETFRRYV